MCVIAATNRDLHVAMRAGEFRQEGPVGSLQKEMANHERMLIERALAETQGRVSGPGGAAMILHLPPSTLSAKMKAFKIFPSKFKIRQA